MKSKYWLLALALSSAVVYAPDRSATVSATIAVTETAPKVGEEQAATLKSAMEAIVAASDKASGEEEFYKIVKAETQTNSRETPLQGAVTAALEKKILLVCFQEGTGKIVASNDPALLDKDASAIKTAGGKSVYELATENVKSTGKAGAIFTYNGQAEAGDPLVNGKPAVHGRLAMAFGSAAFPKFSESEHKFLFVGIEKIANA